MKEILISNIGNRNITYKSEILNSKTFRFDTEKIWNNINIEKEFISIQIIQNHITSNTERIILITTQQENLEYNFQDTIFEGYILKVLLEEKYNIPVEIEIFNRNPTNENEIFPFYSVFFRKLLKNGINSKLIFNDAGGTPQMKLAVKELLGYYLTSEKYEIVYTDQNDMKRVVERIYKNKYVLLKTAQKFVNEFNYNAAIRVLSEIHPEAGVSVELTKLVEIAALRLNFETESVIKMLNADPSFVKHFNPFFKHFSPKRPPGNAIGFSQIKPIFQLSIFELASICELYFKTQNYTLAVATYYRLAEESFQRFAYSHGQYRLSEFEERDRFLTENFDDLSKAYSEFQSGQVLRCSYGLTTLALYAYIHADDEFRNLAVLFMKTISMFRNNPYKGIDLLRNQCFLAHKNNAVTAEMIHKTEPDFIGTILPLIFKQLKMPEENIYFGINRLLNNEFLNN